MAAMPEIPVELLAYEGKLDARFLADERLPVARRLWLCQQYERGEINTAQIAQYVHKYVNEPQTVAPAGEATVTDEYLTEVELREEPQDTPDVATTITQKIGPDSVFPPGFAWSEEEGRPIFVGEDALRTDLEQIVDGAIEELHEELPPEKRGQLPQDDDPTGLDPGIPSTGQEMREQSVEEAGHVIVPPEVIEQETRVSDGAPAIVKRMWASEAIPEAKKEELAKRYEAGTLGEVMLGVLIDSYEEDADEQTDSSDEVPPTPSDVIQTPVTMKPMGSTSAAVLVPPHQPQLDDAPLTTAAALLPPDEEEIPPPPSESLPPPPGMEMHGIFAVEKGRYGPNTWGVDITHPDGTHEPVMQFLEREHPSWDGPTVGTFLMQGGLPQERAVSLGRQRQGQLDGVVVATHHPAVSQLSDSEIKHYADKDAFSRAFIEAQSKKKASK